MKTNTLFQVRFRPSVKPPRGFTKSAHYNVTETQYSDFRKQDEYLIGNTWLPAKDFIKIEIEDAPVFKKPVLRKIASLKPDEVIECNDPEVVKAVLEQAIKEGLKDAEATLIQINESESIDSYPLCIGYKYKINDCFFQNNGISYSGRSFYESECCTILPASKFVEVAAEAKGEQVEIDRPIESYKPFPYDYEIPENTRIVVIESHLYSGENSTYIKAGETGVTIDKSTCPDVKFDSGILHHNGKSYLDILSHNLAPLDDRDHPEHPEFGKKKQKETITQAQKDECRKLQERIKELEALCELRQQDIDNFADDLSDCNELINRMKELAKSSLSASNDMLNRAALRAIANGEI